MAVRIRLMRMGSKRRPFYRFVVADSRGKRDGGFLDQVGHYNPIEKPLKIEVDEDKVFDWLAKGAQLSDGARSLLKKTGTLARWDAKCTGREAPPKTLPTEERPAKQPAAEAPAPESLEEAPSEEPAEAAPTGDLAEAAPAEEVSGEESAEAGPAAEGPATAEMASDEPPADEETEKT
jgi:small subunit ribosomal protein S16